jgi:hypothetical protein
MSVHASQRTGTALVLLVASVAVCPATALTAPGVVLRQGSPVAERRGDVAHLYRIVGKIRFLLFWAGADDVGGARITWHDGDRDQVVSLLIGSDPQRAPRSVNEWGYVREDLAGDSTTIFGIRTVSDGDSPDAAEARRTQAGGLAEFGVLCSTVSTVDVESRTTTAYVPRDVTYRDIGRVLDALERSARWKQVHTRRPAGVAPGFLIALDQLMRSSAAAARGLSTIPKVPRLAYVYKDAVYDLIARRVERVAQLRTHSGLFQNLLRTEFAVRNRATGSTTDFRVTYGTEGSLAGVPVYAQYQPNWWFKVELELDEGADVPDDPAGQLSIRQRIDAQCRLPAG